MSKPKNPRIQLAVLAMVALAVSTNAQVPNMINYQGRLTDNAGDPVADGDYLIKFKIYGSESGDDSLWSSNYQIIGVSDGLFDYQLGSIVPLPGDLFIGDSVRYLGIRVGTDPEISPRTRLISVPYAYQAAHADDANIIPPLSLTGASADPIIEAENTGTGPGVKGESQALTGVSYGGYFHAMSDQARAVYGHASNMYGSGQNFGGYFETDGTSGTGVLGYANNVSGTTYGGQFRANSSSGTGVYGYAQATYGTTYGVRGRSDSPSGYAGYFEGRVFTDATVEMNGFKMATGASDGYVLTSDADGNGTWQVAKSGRTKAMCADMYEGITNSRGQITITFPVAFSTVPYFSVTGRIMSGPQAGQTAHIPKPAPGASDVTVTIQYWDGAAFTNVGDNVNIMLSYTAMEK